MKKYYTFLWNTNASTAEFRILTPVRALRKMGLPILCNPVDKDWDTGYSPWEKEMNLPNESHVFKDRAREMWGLIQHSKVLFTEMVKSKAGFELIAGAWRLRRSEPSHAPAIDPPVIITTVDDWVFEIPPSHPAFRTYGLDSESVKWFGAQLVCSDAWVCSTEYLATQYRNYQDECIKNKIWARHKPIYVAGNFLDSKEWPTQVRSFPLRKNKGTVRLFFEGGYAHKDNLKLIEEPIRHILKKYKSKVDFVNLSPYNCEKWKKLDNYHRLNGTNVKEFPQYVVDLRPDIGLAPMLDNNFMRCKSNLRYLIYSAVGIPTIASSVLTYDECKIKAHEPWEWVEAIEGLMDDAKRQEEGAKAKRYVMKNYGMKACSKVYAEILKKCEGRLA